MSWVLDVDGVAFKHEEYVDYTHALTTAGTLTAYTILLAVAWFYFSPGVPQTIMAAMAYLGVFGVLYLWLTRTARSELNRAKSIKRYAEARQEMAPIVATVFAKVVIKTLLKIRDGGDP